MILIIRDFKSDKSSVSAEVRSLIHQLLTLWDADWENADYLGVILPDLMKHLDKATPEERGILRKIKQSVTDSEWNRLPNIIAEERQRLNLVNVARQEITKQISFFRLNRAHELFLQHANLLDSDWYTKKRSEQIAKRKVSIEDLLFSERFAEAEELYKDSLTVRLCQVLCVNCFIKRQAEARPPSVVLRPSRSVSLSDTEDRSAIPPTAPSPVR